jgi:hypothetical protein
MTTPDDKHRRSPVDRFRSILSAEQSKEQAPAARKYPKRTVTPRLNLPKARPQAESQAPVSKSPISNLPPLPPAEPSMYRSERNRFLPAFWTAASIISLLVNAILLILVIALLRNLGSLNAVSLGSGILGGLYTNFERMDQAHITTTIPIQTNIPLDLTVPVQTTTGITLAKDASIPGAHVKINTPLFNIDAPANVTLPAGTSMEVAMSFSLPVQAQVPVSLSVPVDIALQDTELHPAIVGLQDTLRPLYCMLTPAAQSLTGEPVCR